MKSEQDFMVSSISIFIYTVHEYNNQNKRIFSRNLFMPKNSEDTIFQII